MIVIFAIVLLVIVVKIENCETNLNEQCCYFAKLIFSSVCFQIPKIRRKKMHCTGTTPRPVPARLALVGEGRGVEDTSLPATNIQRTVEVASVLAKSFTAGKK